MPRGGFREGAGRKRKAQKYARPINQAEKKIADRLPELVDNLLVLADGGYDIGTETLEPAGLVFVGDGETRSLAFPHLDPEQLVVVKRTRQVATPDRAANQYLLDRIMGKTTERMELTGTDGGPVEVEDRVSLSDDARAERVARLLERARTRAAGPAAEPGPDLGAAARTAD